MSFGGLRHHNHDTIWWYIGAAGIILSVGIFSTNSSHIAQRQHLSICHDGNSNTPRTNILRKLSSVLQNLQNLQCRYVVRETFVQNPSHGLLGFGIWSKRGGWCFISEKEPFALETEAGTLLIKLSLRKSIRSDILPMLKPHCRIVTHANTITPL